MPHPDKNDDYNSEPVRYCSRCYSLKIKYEESIDSDCCMDCGCSDTAEATIEEWEKLYEKRYSKKYVEKTKNPRDTFVFRLSLDELKNRVYKSPCWREICRTLYPTFPECYGKADSVILLFDVLIRDNRLSDLRLLLLKYYKY